MDLSRAYQEVKSLPDEALANELANPSGMVPSYLVMAEMEDRKALRSTGGVAGQLNRPSMKDELLKGIGAVQQRFAQGGMVEDPRKKAPQPTPVGVGYDYGRYGDFGGAGAQVMQKLLHDNYMTVADLERRGGGWGPLYEDKNGGLTINPDKAAPPSDGGGGSGVALTPEDTGIGSLIIRGASRRVHR